MARPQSPDFDKRKDAIVTAAAALFAKRGFLGTSVSDLADACATSKSLIYHYFKSKEDILFAVMSRHLDDLLDIAVDEGSLPIERIRELTHGFMAAYVEAADFQKVLLNELDNLPPQARSDIVKRQRLLITRVERDIAHLHPAAEKGELRARTMLYFGMINWAHTWFRLDGEITPGRLADLAVDTMLGES
jgi:AcrR family transcriptional regulator